MEKFVKMSLNRSQRFLCYYTTNEAAFDADSQPKTDFWPNFDDITMVDKIGEDGKFDGGFTAQLLSFRCKYSLMDADILNIVKMSVVLLHC